MRLYRERLGVPAWWWLATLVSVLVLGTMLWTVVPIPLGIACYAVLGIGSVAVLLLWGAATIEVCEATLRAGQQMLPLAEIGEVLAMDIVQTRALRGPAANPAAYLLIRPYLPESVYVEVVGVPQDQPYWLIGTRQPASLVAAIEDARRRAGQIGTCDDADSDHRAGAGRLGAPDSGRAGSPDPRKESNAR